jgi:sugar transferase (PEP-CTERM system associated)
MPNTRGYRIKLAVFFGDAVLVLFSIWLSYYLLGYISPKFLGAAILAFPTYLLSFYIFELYNERLNFRTTYFLTFFLIAMTAATLFLAVVFFLFPKMKFGRSVLLFVFIFAGGIVYVWRLLFYSLFISSLRPMKLLIVGAGKSGRMIYESLAERADFSIVGFIDDKPELAGTSVGKHAVLGPSTALPEIVHSNNVNVIVVAVTQEKRPELLRSLLECKVAGVEIYDMPQFYESISGKLPVVHMHDSWIVYTPFLGMTRNIYMIRVKRIVDVLLSLVLVPLSCPVMVLAAIAIRLDSPGHVFYRQERVGFDGRIFRIIKFRTMRQDAETNGAVWASEDDPRVTCAGGLLRMLRIDELPQLWNVLVGEMSFIGPRPERPEFVGRLREEIPFYDLRHSVKPGITGWAQVNYRYGASMEDALEKLQYDLFYVKNLTAILDIQILLKTIRVVLFSSGAR